MRIDWKSSGHLFGNFILIYYYIMVTQSQVNQEDNLTTFSNLTNGVGNNTFGYTTILETTPLACYSYYTNISFKSVQQCRIFLV